MARIFALSNSKSRERRLKRCDARIDREPPGFVVNGHQLAAGEASCSLEIVCADWSGFGSAVASV
jgi:hypothetical protein